MAGAVASRRFSTLRRDDACGHVWYVWTAHAAAQYAHDVVNLLHEGYIGRVRHAAPRVVRTPSSCNAPQARLCAVVADGARRTAHRSKLVWTKGQVVPAAAAQSARRLRRAARSPTTSSRRCTCTRSALRDAKLGIIEANFISMPARLLATIRTEGPRLVNDLETGSLDPAVAAHLDTAAVNELHEALGGPNAGGGGACGARWRRQRRPRRLSAACGRSSSSSWRTAGRLRLVRRAAAARGGRGRPIALDSVRRVRGSMAARLEPTADGSTCSASCPRRCSSSSCR